MPLDIPFNRPRCVGSEFAYIAESLASGHLSGDGTFTKRCHALLESTLGVPKALLTTSCTHALELAALLLNLRRGDEVIVPSFTFVSTANAFVLRGAKAIFADVRPDTLNIDETKLASLVTPRTKAIVVVHYAGVGCEMDAIGRLAAQHGITVIEDNAHGLFGKYRGRYLGTIGALAAQSFHETKNFSCGEGGALLINAPDLVKRAEIIREKGTNRTQFWRGEVDKYTWIDVGSSYLPADMLAAFLLAQLEARERIQAQRRAIWERYQKQLEPWAAGVGAQLPVIPQHCQQAYHLFYLVMPTAAAQRQLIAQLKALGIHAVFHYLPLHLSPMGQQMGGKAGDCPVTESVSDRLVRLPFFASMTPEEQNRVVESVHSFRASR